MKIKFTSIILFIFLFLLASCMSEKENKVVTIGTGSTAGIYYPTGKLLSDLLTAILKKKKVKVEYISTGGSVYNIHAVLSNDLEFAIAQSDKQYNAWKGKEEWSKKGPQKNLRSVFSIHPESILLLASLESNIYKVIDLVGKSVNLGNPGSGQLGNAIDVLKAYGLDEKNVIPEYLNAKEATERFLNGRIDAFFYTIGNPNEVVLKIIENNKKFRFIPLESVSVTRLVDKYSYYVETVVKKEIYPSILSENLKTFGVKATLVTSKDVDSNLVYLLTKAVFDNFEKFKTSHPSLTHLTKKNCLLGLTAPLHPGALKYYQESGLLKYIPSNLLSD